MLLLLFVSTLFLVSSSIRTASNNNNVYISQSEENYLRMYKYMPEANRGVGTAENDYEIYKAIKKLQEFFHLEVTGYMNEQTRSLMAEPRCGLPDIINIRENYKLHNSSWKKKNLTWKVLDYSKTISKENVDTSIQFALNLWSEVSGLTFEYKPNSGVDMDIGFYTGFHNMHEPQDFKFDGKGNKLAHGFYPDNKGYLDGDLHLDDDEEWVVKRKFYETQKAGLRHVLLHEIGHTLGIRHSNKKSSIMWPIFEYRSEIKLGEDDINAIQALYGKNNRPDTTRSPPTTTTTTPTTTTTTQTTTTTTQARTTRMKTTKFQIITRRTTYRRPITYNSFRTTFIPTNEDIFCSGIGIDAAVEYGINSYLLFKDSKVRKITINGESTTLNIRDLFKGSLIENVKINAVIKTHETYSWRNIDGQWRNAKSGNNATYVFQGAKIHIFIEENGVYYETGINPIRNFYGFPINVDAAFTWSGNQQLYIIKGFQYYRMSIADSGFVIDNGFPKYLSEWKGLPHIIDAALHMSQFDMTMFFRGNHYYKYDDNTISVSNNYPRLVGTDWLSC